jgi:hypothetical protein
VDESVKEAAEAKAEGVESVMLFGLPKSRRFIGFYLLAVGVLGSLALPKSPFWVGVVSSAVLVGAGYGWVR